MGASRAPVPEERKISESRYSTQRRSAARSVYSERLRWGNTATQAGVLLYRNLIRMSYSVIKECAMRPRISGPGPPRPDFMLPLMCYTSIPLRFTIFTNFTNATLGTFRDVRSQLYFYERVMIISVTLVSCLF